MIISSPSEIGNSHFREEFSLFFISVIYFFLSGERVGNRARGENADCARSISDAQLRRGRKKQLLPM